MALTAIKGEKARAELAKLHDVPAVHMVAWKAQLQEGAAGVFDAGAAASESAPVPYLKLAQEKDFASGAVSKAALQSARQLSTGAICCC